MSSNLIVLCGIPGSGKTTLSEQIANEQDVVLHCFDKRQGAFSPTKAPSVRLQMCEDIAEDLRNGNSVVCDDLHTQSVWRENLLNAVAGTDCRKALIVMTTPLDECLRRNANRKCRLPDAMIHSINGAYEPPTLEEGWDEIVFVTTETK